MKVLGILLLSVWGCMADKDVIREELSVGEQWGHAIELCLSGVPDGVQVVHISGKELNDLTGDLFEAGYTFAYNSIINCMIYPNVDSQKMYTFRYRYSKDGKDFSEWSRNTIYTKVGKDKIEFRAIKRNYIDAKDECEREGKRLIVISNEKVNMALKNVLLEQEAECDAWIGLYDRNFDNSESRADWGWVSGKSLSASSFENFADEYIPRTSKSDESFVYIRDDGVWERADINTKQCFFCENLSHKKVNDVDL